MISWRKHNLEIIDIFNEDATMNSFGLHYQSKTVLVRKKLQKSWRLLELYQNRK
jgi:hypothetical protein